VKDYLFQKRKREKKNYRPVQSIIFTLARRKGRGEKEPSSRKRKEGGLCYIYPFSIGQRGKKRSVDLRGQERGGRLDPHNSIEGRKKKKGTTETNSIKKKGGKKERKSICFNPQRRGGVRAEGKKEREREGKG